ncbi:MAG TPA: CPBP family intramembrane glutamic endopeptidase [Terriglobales bacterium]|nr:CPBP family intramembrane glutamic endopeptidase [Terriglobales bacterium]
MNDFTAPAHPALDSIGEPPVEPQRPASMWHYVYTLAIVAVIVFMSFAGAHQQGQFAQKRGHIIFYALTMGTELVLLGLAYLGMRFSRMNLREVIGGRWNTFEDFGLDIVIAFGFWILSYLVLIGLALAMHLANPGAIDEGKKTIQLLAPHGGLQLALWISMSVVAGFVEEIVFRGYFQRQFSTLLRNVWAGMLASAAIFGLSHAYEGRQRMLLIFVYGAMFGTLAILRNSLRPGMMAHAWHDSFEGIILVIADKLVKSGAIK